MPLWVPSGPGFQFRPSNVSSLRPQANFGTLVTSGTSDAYDPYVEILSDTLITEDCYGLYIGLSGISLAGSERSMTVTIGKDETGGTSYTDWLTDLICGGAAPAAGSSAIIGTVEYYFPVFIKAGTALAAKMASNSSTGVAGYVRLQAFGRPRYPEQVWCGTKFQSFGASAGNGTAITSGTTSEGSWTQVGSAPTVPLCWWQYGFQVANTALTARVYHVDLARGDGSNKHIIFQDESVRTNTSEQVSKILRPGPQYWRRATANDNIYMRAQCSGTPDSGLEIAAYGVG